MKREGTQRKEAELKKYQGLIQILDTIENRIDGEIIGLMQNKAPESAESEPVINVDQGRFQEQRSVNNVSSYAEGLTREGSLNGQSLPQ